MARTRSLKSVAPVGATRSNGDSGTDVLSAEDFFGGSENLKEVVVTALTKNGKPGRVYLRYLSAQAVLDFLDLPKEATPRERRSALMNLIGQAVTDAKGVPLFDSSFSARLSEIPVGVFNQLADEVMLMAGLTVTVKDKDSETAIGGTEGKDSAATHTTDSPTD